MGWHRWAQAENIWASHLCPKPEVSPWSGQGAGIPLQGEGESKGQLARSSASFVYVPVLPALPLLPASTPIHTTYTKPAQASLAHPSSQPRGWLESILWTGCIDDFVIPTVWAAPLPYGQDLLQLPTRPKQVPIIRKCLTVPLFIYLLACSIYDCSFGNDHTTAWIACYMWPVP